MSNEPVIEPSPFASRNIATSWPTCRPLSPYDPSDGLASSSSLLHSTVDAVENSDRWTVNAGDDDGEALGCEAAG